MTATAVHKTLQLLGNQASVTRRMPIGLMVLLALMAAWLLVRLVWLLITGPTLITGDRMVTSEQTTPDASPELMDYNTQLWADIFGQSNEDGPEIERLPLDQSALVLVGVLSQQEGPSSESSQGYAIIRAASGGDRLYRVNDALPDGRRVDRIATDRVVLSSGTGREVLVLREDLSAPKSPPASPGEQAIRRTEPLPSGAGIGSVGGLGQSLALSSGNKAESIAPLSPVSTGGYRLRPGPNAQLFVAAGLQVGDVIRAINGQPVSVDGPNPVSSDALNGLMERVMQGESISVTIERQGREMTLQPDVRALQGMINQRTQPE